MIIYETIQEVYHELTQRAEIVLSGVHYGDLWDFINYYEWSNLVSVFIPEDVITLVRYFSQSKEFRELYTGDSELLQWLPTESYEKFLVRCMSWVLFNHLNYYIRDQADKIRERLEEKRPKQDVEETEKHTCQFCRSNVS